MIEILNLYHMCKTFRQLPRPGGVLDQPWKIMMLFQTIDAAESERAARENKRREAANAGYGA